MTKNKNHQPPINIWVNDRKFVAPKSAMTGREIKELASIPLENRLFLETPGPKKEDISIGDEEIVKLKSGMRFYNLPPMKVGLILS